ncbi:MAG: RluA family pseudouridine synthase [bacterium]|nr:RluA family pseudouridine synthase [bacterium]
MDAPQLLVVPLEARGLRLDQFLMARLPDLSRTRIQDLIAGGHVLLGDSLARSSHRLRGGESLIVDLPPPAAWEVEPEDIEIDIQYEDRDIVVVNKAQGLVVHPAPGSWKGTLVNALLYHCGDLSGVGGVLRPGIVHRLDKDTSGLMVVAKNDSAHHSLADQIAARTAGREYLAVIHGVIDEESGTVDLPIARHPTDRIKMAVVATGRDAVTHWRVLERFHDMTFLALKLETGRTHQIRVHMAHLGHPVVGDPVYGPARSPSPVKLRGQALHAFRLSFSHPRTEEPMTFEVAPPERFETLLRTLRAGA